MGTTPILKLRYPAPTDRFRLGYAQMQTLAEDVDAARLDYLDMSNGASSQPCANNTWQLCGVGTTTGSRGTGIVAAGSNVGIRCNRAGRFMVTGYAEFPLNATGRRGISFTTDPGGTNAVNSRRVIGMAVAGGTSPVAFSFVINLGAGAAVGLLLFQDSGTALNATGALLTVSEIG